MSKTKIHVGLEIGTSKTCMVVGEVKSDSSVKILGVGQTKSAGVRKGEIYDYPLARACVKDALVKAEDLADVEIGSVFLSVTGSHICGVNSTGTFRLPDGEKQIAPEHVEEAKDIARDVHIPQEHVYLHDIIRQYRVDGFEHATSPVGCFGKTVEADYHVVHGIGARIQNSLRCVREMPLDVDGVVFAPIAAAQVALNREARDRGALVIDIGGGTTDYVVYVDGAVKQSGVLAIGGDHITNDISMGLRIPMAKSERLKIEEGDATLGNALPGETIFLKDETGFAGRDVERETLNTIIHYRLREVFELLRRALDGEPYLPMLGAGIVITGGCSLLRGIGPLAQDVFGVPATVARSKATSGLIAAGENPQFSTAIGLLRYGQAAYANRPQKEGIREFFGKIFGRR